MEKHDANHRSERLFLTRARQFGFWLVCLSTWMVPLFLTGWSRKSLRVFPQAMSFQHNAAALFTSGVRTWDDYHHDET